MSLPDNTRLQDLTSRLCDGDITTHELDELGTLLNNNEKAIQEYVAYTTLHFQLGLQLKNPRSTEQLTANAMKSLDDDASLTKVTASGSPSNPWFTRRFAMFAVAASLLFVAAFLIFPFHSAPAFTARILQKIDCDWGQEHWGVPQSAELEPGREIKLDRGLMMLEFGNGAELTLEAPVRFKILAQDRGALISGKLTARVPKRGRGFSVQMPLGEVIDLGTNFGLLVDELGNCHTHVFEGNVVVRSDLELEGQPQREWDLAAGAAMKLTAADKVDRFAAQPSSFVHSLRDFRPSTAKGKPSLEMPSNTELVLWLDSASRLQLDEESRVVSWGDLSSDANSVEDGAWQVDAKRRPLWKKHSRGNKPALRFDGSHYLATTPFLSGNDVSIICVFQGKPGEFPSHRSAQLLNLNGSPSLMLRQTRDNQILGSLVSAKQNEEPSVSNRVEGPLPTSEDLVVCAYIYGRSANRSSLYVNSKLIGESPASQDVAIRSPKYIGCSSELSDFFIGDIYEILVFNSVLSDEQCIQVSSELMKKYGISEEDREPRVLSGLVPAEE